MKLISSLLYKFAILFNFLVLMLLLATALLTYYFLQKHLQKKKGQKTPPMRVVQNMLLIALCFVLVTIGGVFVTDFINHSSANVFEEMYKDYTRNHCELLADVPVFRTGEESFLFPFEGRSDGVSHWSYQENIREHRLTEAGIEIEPPLGQTESISITFYRQPEQIKFTQIIAGGAVHIETFYVYDCKTKTLTYSTNHPELPKDPFLEDRILAAWFKYSDKDSPAASVVRNGQKPSFGTRFSPDDWGAVTVVE